jgi:membrane dipeptidase
MIDHVVNVTGSTDTVGIGTDMSLGSYPLREEDPWGAPDYGKPFAEYGEKITADPRSPRRNLDGFSDFAEVVSFADALEKRGYSKTDVGKVLGENYLRVAAQAWG